MDWQTVVAGLVVAATFTIFLVRLARRKPLDGCDKTGCGCGKPKSR